MNSFSCAPDNCHFLHKSHLLELIVIDDVLISRARLSEGIELVHMVHVPP